MIFNEVSELYSVKDYITNLYVNLGIAELVIDKVTNLPKNLEYHTFEFDDYNLNPNSNTEVSFNTFQDVGINNLHQLGYTGTSQVYVQIDDGINQTHPSFENRIINQVDVSYRDATVCAGHGTAVAGIATAGDNVKGYQSIVGTAPDANIISYSLGCRDGSYGGNFLEAYNDIITKNDSIQILNTSFGGNGVILDRVLERLAGAGILVVGSVGNTGPGFQSAGPGGPGNSIHSLSVGATINSTHIADFSSRGYAHNIQMKPDIVAPGVSINTTSSDGKATHTVLSGTSLSSPFVVGGLLSILEAMEGSNLLSNPGVLKAAIMKGGSRILDDQRIDGHGLVNFTKSLEILQRASTQNRIPQLVELTPDNGPNSFISTLPANTFATSEITMISSHPNEVTFTFTGDLSGKASVVNQSRDYSQSLQIDIDTHQLTSGDTLNGTIIAHIGNDTSEANLSFVIGKKFKGTVALDLGHTWWDLTNLNRIGGGNIGTMAHTMNQEGWIVEEVDKLITPELLSNYEMLWISDGFNHFENRTSDLVGILENPLLDQEIEAISDFVQKGGNLLIDGIGTIINQYGDFSFMNGSEVNPLIEEYGISFDTTPISSPLGYHPAYSLASTSVTQNIDSITQFGNFLKVSSPGYPLTFNPNGKATSAFFNNLNGGKVFVTSTNYWLDNYGLKGEYGTNGGGKDDLLFTRNVLDWFGKNETLHVIKDIKEGNLRTISFISSSPSFQIDSNIDYEISYLQNESYTLEIVENNQYNVRLTLDDQYFEFHHKFPVDLFPRITSYSLSQVDGATQINGIVHISGDKISNHRIAVFLNDFELTNESIKLLNKENTIHFNVDTETLSIIFDFYNRSEIIVQIYFMDETGSIQLFEFPLDFKIYPGEIISQRLLFALQIMFVLVIVKLIYNEREYVGDLLQPRYL